MYAAVKDADINGTAKFRILYGTVYNLPSWSKGLSDRRRPYL